VADRVVAGEGKGQEEVSLLFALKRASVSSMTGSAKTATDGVEGGIGARRWPADRAESDATATISRFPADETSEVLRVASAEPIIGNTPKGMYCSAPSDATNTRDFVATISATSRRR
jgi:hypothetical protein